MTLAHDCETKGPGDSWVVRQLNRDLEDSGCKDVCMQSNREAAMLALQTVIADARSGMTVERRISSARRDRPDAKAAAGSGGRSSSGSSGTRRSFSLGIILETTDTPPVEGSLEILRTDSWTPSENASWGSLR